MQHQKRNFVSEYGVSEVIGAVMLVSVVVLAISIIGIFLFSGGTPQKVPALDATISNTGRTVYIYHNGGDVLQQNEMYVTINGQEVPMKKGTDAGWTSWSSGESLNADVPGTSPINSVKIIYGISGSGVVLASAIYGEGEGMSSGGPICTITHSVSGGGGTITPPSPQTVSFGSTPVFTFNPDGGYNLDTVTVNGNPVTPTGNTYTFPPVTEDQNMVATFAIQSYDITHSVPLGNGTITPPSPQTVSSGDTPTFTFNPNSGYHLGTVTVNGNPVTPTGDPKTYTFPPVTADQDMVATFAIDTFTITHSVSGSGGTITPPSPQTVSSGDTPTFTFNPDAGYHLNTTTVNGNPVTPAGDPKTYTFPPVTADQVMVATFSDKYRITASAGTGGTITPSGVVIVTQGTNQLFTIAPGLGNHTYTRTVNGTTTTYPPLIPSTYTFTNVQKDHTISITFAQNPRGTILFDDFEDGNSAGWTTTGTVATGAYTPRNGNYDTRLTGGTTPRSGITRTISTVGYSDIIASVAWAATALDANEYVNMYYSTGGTPRWVLQAQRVNSATLVTYTSPILPVAAAHNSNFVLRLNITANGGTEYGYLDDIRLTGIPDTI